MAIATRLIGRLGGGRESQEFSVTTTTITRSVGEGEWLCAINYSGSYDTYINGDKVRVAVVTGPASVTFRMGGYASPTGYIAPLT